jgi:hypothetical protein
MGRAKTRKELVRGYNLYFLKMVRSALFCDITQRIVVISYQRLGTTDRSLFLGSRSIFLTLEDEGCIQTSARNLPLR